MPQTNYKPVSMVTAHGVVQDNRRDSSTIGAHGIFQGGRTAGIPYPQGRWIQFGDTHYMSFPRPSAITTSSTFSVSIWAKNDNTPTSEVDAVWSIFDTGGSRVCSLNHWSSGNGAFAIRGTVTGTAQQLSSSVTVTAWHHWCVTYDGSSSRPLLYVDGVDLSAGTGPNWGISGTEDAIRIGQDFNASNGQINYAQLEVFERELTPSEVLQSMMAPGTLPDAAVYATLAGVDPLLTDLSGNARHGTYNGFITAAEADLPIRSGYAASYGFPVVAAPAGGVPRQMYHHRHHNRAA